MIFLKYIFLLKILDLLHLFLEYYFKCKKNIFYNIFSKILKQIDCVESIFYTDDIGQYLSVKIA